MKHEGSKKKPEHIAVLRFGVLGSMPGLVTFLFFL